jgi:hypothetical protein
MRIVFVTFLLGHAAVHAVMWSLPYTDAVDDMPFDPAQSWLIGDRAGIAAGLAGVAAGGFVIAAIGFATRTTWWPAVLGAASAVSIVLMILFLSSYWIVGIALSTALGIYAWLADPSA